MKAVLDAAPAKPSSALAVTPDAQATHPWHDALQGDLDNVVLKALRKLPQDRYRSVERFIDDIQRYLTYRPVQARPPTPWHVARLFVRRHVAASVAVAVGMAAAGVLGGLAWQQSHARELAYARSDTIRDFMFDFVNDAERDEPAPGSEPTGRQMVAAAVERARKQFVGQPRLQGELLAELGRMHGRLGDEQAARAVLAEAVGLLQWTAPAGDAALNKARAQLAAVRMDEGDTALRR